MSYYQYGTTQPHLVTAPATTAEPDLETQPTVYQYIPQAQSAGHTFISAPAQPPAATRGTTRGQPEMVYVPTPPIAYTSVLGQPVSYFATTSTGEQIAYPANQYVPDALQVIRDCQQGASAPLPVTAPGVVHWLGQAQADVGASTEPKIPPLTPYNATPDQKWWCQELDSSFAMRTTNDIVENCQPGRWICAPASGHPYFIREPATSGA